MREGGRVRGSEGEREEDREDAFATGLGVLSLEVDVPYDSIDSDGERMCCRPWA